MVRAGISRQLALWAKAGGAIVAKKQAAATTRNPRIGAGSAGYGCGNAVCGAARIAAFARRVAVRWAGSDELRLAPAGVGMPRCPPAAQVQNAQYILGSFGSDFDLRRFGLALAARGNKSAKKRALIAVARKLVVLLHRL